MHRDIEKEEIDISFILISTHQTPYSNQISEAIEIKLNQREENILVWNAKTEYNRCLLPNVREMENNEELEKENLEELKLMKETSSAWLQTNLRFA